MNEIMVSIICNTYNQEKYIADALESFIMQKTDFKYEILVHDDASTDNTPNIIKEYELKYQDIIKPIYQKENKYSQNISIGKNYQYPRIKGKYVALCEGDDFWTDSNKLQKQVEELERHPKCDICAHAATMVNSETKERIKDIAPSQQKTIFSIEDVIEGDGGFVATNSLMIRRENIIKFYKFREICNIDYSLQIQGALRGGMLYLVDNMSAYRFQSQGSWTSNIQKDTEKYSKHFDRVSKMLEQLNIETDKRYDEVIRKKIRWQQYQKMLVLGNDREIIKEFPDILKTLTFKQSLKIKVRAYFPCLIKVNEWRKQRGKK